MEDLKKLKISIGGKIFYVSTDENEKDVEKAALMVNSLIEKNKNLILNEDSKFWVLAVLELAIELAKNKSQLMFFQDGVEQLNYLLEKDL